MVPGFAASVSEGEEGRMKAVRMNRTYGLK